MRRFYPCRLYKPTWYDYSFVSVLFSVQRAASGKFLCPFCQGEYFSRAAVRIHMRVHTGEKPFKCNVCGESFQRKDRLKLHKVKHLPPETVVGHAEMLQWHFIIEQHRTFENATGHPQMNTFKWTPSNVLVTFWFIIDQQMKWNEKLASYVRLCYFLILNVKNKRRLLPWN